MTAWRISGPGSHGFGLRIGSWSLVVLFETDGK